MGADANGGDGSELMSSVASVSVSESSMLSESVVNKLSRVCGIEDFDHDDDHDDEGGRDGTPGNIGGGDENSSPSGSSSSSLIIDGATSPTATPTPPRSPSPPLAESRWSTSTSAEVEVEGITAISGSSVPSSTSKNSQASTRHSDMINVSVSTVKRYNLMVAGPSGSGKSTFCTRLLRRYFPDFELHNGARSGEGSSSTVKDGGPTMKIGERGRGEKMQGCDTKIIVTVVDTPGFGDSINNNDRFDPVVQYILEQNRRYERNELFRKPEDQADDTRVHCCFYFLAPHRITPLDCEFMRRLQDRVAITPIVAKADTMTIGELETHLLRIRSFLKENSISIFDYGESEEDVDERWMDRPVIDGTAYSRVGRSLLVNPDPSSDDPCTDGGTGVAAPPAPASVVPAEPFPLASLPQLRNVFAVISGERHYVWGKASEEDPRHSDAQRLHRILFRDGSLGRLRRHADVVHDAWRLHESRRVRRRIWCVVGPILLSVVAVCGMLLLVAVGGMEDVIGGRTLSGGGTYLAGGDVASPGHPTGATADGVGVGGSDAPIGRRGYSLGGVTCSPDTMRCHLHHASE